MIRRMLVPNKRRGWLCVAVAHCYPKEDKDDKLAGGKFGTIRPTTRDLPPMPNLQV
jgi:hypothetical protein